MDSKKYFWLIGIVIVVLVIGLIIGVTISGAAFRLLSWSGEESKTVDSLLKKDTLTTSDTEKTCSEYGRIILKVSNTKKYAIWAETVPPSIGEGAGVLKIPLVERKHKGGVSGYDYLQFTRILRLRLYVFFLLKAESQDTIIYNLLVSKEILLNDQKT